jgi:hypothetical protein
MRFVTNRKGHKGRKEKKEGKKNFINDLGLP